MNKTITRTPKGIKRIHESINNAFNYKRLVFLYDSEKDCLSEI